MHKPLLHLHLFILLLINTTHICAMLLPHEKPSENQFYIPTFLQQRLNAMPLLLERPPFNFLQLLPELQTRTASFATPHSMSNLSITCKSLNQILTFQTPGIWNIVTDSINAISYEKLPELLIKAHLCAEMATEEKQKEFYLSIKEKILSCYDLKAENLYHYQNRHEALISFNPFLEQNPDKLLAACYTGDKIIVHQLHKTRGSLSDLDVSHLLDVTIDREKVHIIPLLCEWYTPYLEKLFQQCSSYTTYDKPTHTLCWSGFIANSAVTHKKKKSFECIIIYYKQYLNIVDKNCMTYLDRIIHYFKKDTDSPHYPEYGKIVMKYGGTGNEETIRIMNESKK